MVHHLAPLSTRLAASGAVFVSGSSPCKDRKTRCKCSLSWEQPHDWGKEMFQMSQQIENQARSPKVIHYKLSKVADYSTIRMSFCRAYHGICTAWSSKNRNIRCGKHLPRVQVCHLLFKHFFGLVMSIVDGLLIPVLVAPTWHCMSLGVKEVLQEITLDVIIAKWIKFQESNRFLHLGNLSRSCLGVNATENS